MFYIKDRYLRRAIVGAANDVPLASLRARGAGLGSAPRTLVLNQFNPSGEDNVLVLSPADGGCFDLYNVSGSAVDAPEAGRGAALAAVFTARSKFAYLDKATRTITVRALVADPGKRVRPPYAAADMLFPASTTGRVLIRCEDRVCLFELQSRRVVAEIAGVVVKYVVWSADGSHVALLGKHAVVLADKDLTQICSVTETVRVKSGVWDESGVFLYTTLNHIKYVLPLPSGDSGIVRTLDAPVYATAARGGNLYVLDREARHKALPIDPTEHQFKLALARRQFDRVLAIIRSARLVGQSVIAYLQRAGYPEVALFFVEDDLTRFNLALDCGNLEIALKAAKAVNSEEAWARLASEALRQGNTEIVELAYQTSKSLDRLSFLYLLTGSREKLAKMGAIAAVRGDGQARYHNALYCGSVEERVKVLEGAGQTALAYVTASTYGLEAEASRLKGYL
jgi:coatomer protein complex subunit alpha (xenin)